MRVVDCFIKWLKKIINDIQYRNSMNNIMDDAMEFGWDADMVASMLKANHDNHYGASKETL